MPIPPSLDEFFDTYYEKAWDIADTTIAMTVKQNGPLHITIDEDSVKAAGVEAGLKKTYESSNPEHSSGAKITTLLGTVVRNCVLSELGKATTESKRAHLVQPAPKKKKLSKEEEQKYQHRDKGIIPGVRQNQTSDGPFEAHEYMESYGWAERKEDLIHLVTKFLRRLPDHDRIIINFWLDNEKTYVQRSLEELGKEKTPRNANWVYQRKDKAIKALRGFFGGEKPDYRDIPLDLGGSDSNGLAISSQNASIHLQSAPLALDTNYDYRKVSTQLIEKLLPSLDIDTAQ